NGYSRKAVLIYVDASLVAAGFGGWTSWLQDGAQSLMAAKTRVSTNSRFASRSLITHELLHALGFQHTCGWPTVMGGYGCSTAAGATKGDVAAFNLGYQVFRTIIASSPTTTLADGLRG